MKEIRDVFDFLEAYGRGKKNDIYYKARYEIDGKLKESMSKIKYPKAKYLDKLNVEEQSDLYFTPNFIKNGYSRKIVNLQSFNAVFIDLDAGRTHEGRYHELDIVTSKKQEFLKTIRSFDIKPSFIVETRNGYHVHWLLKDPSLVKSEEWYQAMDKLSIVFSSDSAVNSPEKLMRLPFSWWHKPSEGMDPFYTKLIEANDVEVCIEEFLEHLMVILKDVPLGATNTSIKVSTSKHHTHNIGGPKGSNLNERILAIKANDYKYFKKQYDNKAMLFSGTFSAVDYLSKNLDLAEFLGIENGTQFSCIFHDDNHPSAFISEPNENEQGTYRYTCRTGNDADRYEECSFSTGTIIHVVEALMGTDREAAREFLFKCFNITIDYLDWKSNQEMLLHENIAVLQSIKEEKGDNALYASVRHYLPLLEYIHHEALKNVKGMQYSKSGEALFFFSQRRAANRFGYACHKKVNQRIAYFSFLKLIKKVPDTDVPNEWMKKASEYKMENGNKETIHFYSVPAYTTEQLKMILERLELWKKCNCSMKAISRDMFLMTFGVDIANEVYPKTSIKKVSKKVTDFKDSFKKALSFIIDDKGWATERDVLEIMKRTSYTNQIREKRVLELTLQELQLQRVPLTKVIKQKYQIEMNYGTKVIIPQSK